MGFNLGFKGLRVKKAVCFPADRCGLRSRAALVVSMFPAVRVVLSFLRGYILKGRTCFLDVHNPRPDDISRTVHDCCSFSENSKEVTVWWQ